MEKNPDPIIAGLTAEEQVQELKLQLQEAKETIDAIRAGQVDALVIQGQKGAELYSLRTADLSYRVFVEGMKEGAVTLSPEGLVLYANQQFAVLVDRPLSEVIGQDFLNFFYGHHKRKVVRMLVKSLYAPVKGDLELGLRGSSIHVQMAFSPLQIDGRTHLGVLTTDLTAQYEAQQILVQKNEELALTNAALEASNHDLQQFASVASHDLQEPLRKIQLFTSKLDATGTCSNHPEALRYIGKINQSATRMKSLIIDVLNYSRLSANNEMVTVVDLNHVVQDLVDDFELRIQEAGASVRCGHLPVLRCNPGQIRQVMQNLISNGLKFIRPGEPAMVTVEGFETDTLSFDAAAQPGGSFVLIRVKDNGIGFEPKFAHRIFSLFERLHAKDKFEGSGIGLAITKKIIEKHGGIIRAVSGAGEGASFEFVLPKTQPIFAGNSQ